MVLATFSLMASASETLIGRQGTGTLIGSRAGMAGFLMPMQRLLAG
jgi:hypothetical protein